MKRSCAGTALRSGLIVLSAIVITMTVASCGRYFTAEIAGYVKDSDSSAGINGAAIRIYLQEPKAADSDGFIAETASVASSGNDGYFNHRIIWQNLLPAFGSEGDTTSLWVGITHDDYLPAIAEIRGILSDTVNFVPDVVLNRATFSVPSVSGGVVDPSGDGVNGIRIVLDLLSTEESRDYVTVTTDIEGKSGRYEFTNVSWRDDEAAGSGSDTENVEISVDDDNYTAAAAVTVLLSSEQEIKVEDNFTVTRADPTNFETTVTGRCLERTGTAPDIVDTAARGVEVVCTYSDDDGPHTLYSQTDTNGEYSFSLQWTDTTARDFIEGSEDTTIPEAEDGLIVEISFEAPFDGASFTGVDNRQMKSWLNPNYVPDAIYVVP